MPARSSAGSSSPSPPQRLHQVVVRLAGAGDAEPGVASAPVDPVQAVLARVGERELDARRRAASAPSRATPARAGCAFGTCSYGLPFDSTVGHHRLTRSRATSAVPSASATLVTILKPTHRPEAREQRERVQAEVEHLLHVAGIEDRHVQASRAATRSARDRRGLAARVVAHQREHAAGARDADEVAVAERVGRAVDARAPCRTTCPARRRSFAPGSWPASWLPQTAVAPSSSLRPGTCTTWCSSSSSRLRSSSLSKPPSGEPW